MTILLKVKTFSFHADLESMYNHTMTKQQPRKRVSMVFLVLGMAFLAIGLATDQTTFTWLAIVFIVLSLIRGGRWLRPRNNSLLDKKDRDH
jgi:hypothetical protein